MEGEDRKEEKKKNSKHTSTSTTHFLDVLGLGAAEARQQLRNPRLPES
jgi:hypothetical protein